MPGLAKDKDLAGWLAYIEQQHPQAIALGLDRVERVRDAMGLVPCVPVITVEHVNRLTAAAAPEWPYPPDGRPGVHRVVVRGDPGVEINTHLGLDGVDHNEGGVIATAARAVNAIDAVCAAAPGLLAAYELPAAHARPF